MIGNNLTGRWFMKKLFLIFALMFSFNSIASSPLPANDVFQVSVKLLDPNTFMLDWQIKPGYFLYSDRISIKVPEDSGIKTGQIHFPEALRKTDHQGRTYTIYRNNLSLAIAVLGERPGETLMTLHYQGCADDGFCYPPETRLIKLGVDDNRALTTVEFYDAPAASEPVEKNTPASSTSHVESVFLNHNLAMVLLIFYGFGLLLAFTPCILPMVPVLSGIIVGHGANISTRKAFFLSLSYVISMAVTYAIIGAVVAMLGSNLQIMMQSSWVISLFSLLFVLLAISMFGYFELKLPVSWQARLAQMNRSQVSGHYISAAIMGCLSILILSPCVTAPLIGVLSYIAQSGNVLIGGFSLFFLGLGMGTPLILIGTSAGRWLPKAGNWMNAVKYFFGIMLLAVAIYLMARILPAPVIMALWSTLLIFSGIFAGALVPAQTHHDKFKQASGIIMLMYGLLILIGTSMGSIDPLQPLANWTRTTPATTSFINQSTSNLVDVQAAIKRAKGKPVMLDFYADWCETCQTLEATTLRDPNVVAALKQFVVLKADITANNADDKALLRHFNVIAPPTFLFFDVEGKEMPQLRLVGDVSTEEFLKHLNALLPS